MVKINRLTDYNIQFGLNLFRNTLHFTCFNFWMKNGEKKKIQNASNRLEKNSCPWPLPCMYWVRHVFNAPIWPNLPTNTLILDHALDFYFQLRLHSIFMKVFQTKTDQEWTAGIHLSPNIPNIDRTGQDQYLDMFVFVVNLSFFLLIVGVYRFTTNKLALDGNKISTLRDIWGYSWILDRTVPKSKQHTVPWPGFLWA